MGLQTKKARRKSSYRIVFGLIKNNYTHCEPRQGKFWMERIPRHINAFCMRCVGAWAGAWVGAWVEARAGAWVCPRFQRPTRDGFARELNISSFVAPKSPPPGHMVPFPLRSPFETQFRDFPLVLFGSISRPVRNSPGRLFHVALSRTGRCEAAVTLRALIKAAQSNSGGYTRISPLGVPALLGGKHVSCFRASR